MRTGLLDRKGKEIRVGDKVRLILDDGEERIFDVSYKTVERRVICHPDFIEKSAKVSITGIVFSWQGYDLFPCVDSEGIPDNRKMEIVEEAQDGRWMNTGKWKVKSDRIYRCSKCGYEKVGTTAFCPGCGAEMNGMED